MKISITIVTFTIVDRKLLVYIEKKQGGVTLPRQSFNVNRSLEAVVSDITTSIQKNVHHFYTEQLFTFENDADGITIAYLHLLPPVTIDQVSGRRWVSLENVSRLSSFDREMIEYGRKRLAWKLEYTNVAYGLLPETFTLSQLQEIYEVALGRILDKRNFRKKINSLGLVTATKQFKKEPGMRPAQLYRFKYKEPMIVEII